MKKLLLTAFLAPLFPGILSFSQINEGGLAPSYQPELIANPEVFENSYQVHELLAPDMDLVRAQDLEASEKDDLYRAGVNIPVSYSIYNSGTWVDLANGDKVWRLGIRIPGAQALGLYFNERVQIPQGGKLFAYNENRRQCVGAYTANTQTFYVMEMIQGEFLTLEYLMPAGSSELPVIDIAEVVYFYRGTEAGLAPFQDHYVPSDDRSHGECEVDAKCSEADSWADQRSAAVRYSFKVSGSTAFCSGTVINNTAQDCTPYILSANHCGEPDANADFNFHMVYFNYQRPTCVPGNTGAYAGAKTQSIAGGIFRASSALGTHPASTGSQVDGADFVLFELEELIPTSYHAYYAGWDRNTAAATSGVCFHHPAGDEKKISTYSIPLTNATYNGGWSSAHWSVKWVATANGHGITEGGSSGSAILNQNGLIVGHLSGGSSFCDSPTATDLYGKFLKAWEQDGTGASSQLKSWLDPANTGAMTLAGTFGNCGLVSAPTYEMPEFNIYPNPTVNLLTVDLTGLNEKVESIELRDVTGRLVAAVTNYDGPVNFDLTNEVAGVYFIYVKTPETSMATRIVKL